MTKKAPNTTLNNREGQKILQGIRTVPQYWALDGTPLRASNACLNATEYDPKTITTPKKKKNSKKTHSSAGSSIIIHQNCGAGTPKNGRSSVKFRKYCGSGR